VRQHTGFVKQLLLIDVGLGNVAKAHDEKLQDASMVGREQFLERAHDTS